MDLFSKFITYLASFIINNSIPQTPSPDWTFTQEWVKKGKALEFTATSTSIPEKCRSNPRGVLVSDNIIQGFHRFWLDGRLIKMTGDPQFLVASSMNNIAEVSCEIIKNGTTLKWTASNLTHYYANFKSWPKVYSEVPWWVKFLNSFTKISGGTLFIVCLLSIFLFFGHGVSKRLLVTYFAAQVAMAAHFVLTSPELLGIALKPIQLHRWHDICLWVGSLLISNLFFRLGILNIIILKFNVVATSLAITIIMFANSLDQAQVGSYIAYVSTLIFLFSSTIKASLLMIKNNFDVRICLMAFSALVFCATGISDLLVHSGVINLPPMYPIGVLGSVFSLSLIINQDINQTYIERNHLRENLEKEVKEKTSELSTKNKSLSDAIVNLKKARADMEQSARLASLGTLAAGIAHEINNSLNYVVGSLSPLKSLLTSDKTWDEGKRKKAIQLWSLMDEGLKLTLDIIRNLKRHAHQNSAKAELLDIRKEIKSVFILLNTSISKKITLEIDLPEQTQIYFTHTSLTQILLNLINNATDILRESKVENPKIVIIGEIEGDKYRLSIIDNGPGVPDDIKDSIFDPFFTTKAVGKGTGLGLHIAYSEMQKNGGTIFLDKSYKNGACFVLIFPRETVRQSTAIAV